MMEKILRSVWMVLFAPVCVGAFYLESKLPVSGRLHPWAQALTLVVLFGAAWGWNQLDAYGSLRELSGPRPARPAGKRLSVAPPGEEMPSTRPAQPEMHPGRSSESLWRGK
ncbi:MAG: hypothetical protein GYA17_22755 [Chloroflexi bacterium]|nr:hypothetical protein [Chloroflexota bacterium]